MSRNTTIRCAGCGHPIDSHLADRLGCLETHCGCKWTPNDVAYELLYGELTVVAPREATTRPIEPDWS